MPIQHAAKNVLSAMNRPGDDKSLLATVKKLRQQIPDAILRTTIMVGFPGESDDDFEILCMRTSLTLCESRNIASNANKQ